MSIVKKNNEGYNKSTYDIPFHEEKYEDIEKDEKIEYSEFLCNPPICLLFFNDGCNCWPNLDKKNRPYKIGDGSIHDALEKCTKCEIGTMLQNNIIKIEEFNKKGLKITVHICRLRGRTDIINKEHYCEQHGSHKYPEYCQRIKCSYYIKRETIIPSEDISPIKIIN